MKRRYRILILIVILLTTALFAVTASAEVKATEVFYTWDENQLRLENSLATVATDNGWVPLMHKLGFDDNLYAHPSCAVGVNPSTPFAGEMQMSLYHIDDNPAGAPGFQDSRDWQLIDCDLDGDGDFDNDDLKKNPLTDGFIPYASGELLVLMEDDPLPCPTGNCDTELVTTIQINLDLNCDGDLSDENLPPAGVCFYAEAQKPGQATWGGNLQARIEAGGGDKTVNFKFEEPTAISLVSLTAEPSAVSWALPAAALALIAGIWIFLRRKVRITN